MAVPTKYEITDPVVMAAVDAAFPKKTGTGWIRVVDIVPQTGAISNKVYLDPPGNSVVSTATASDPDIGLVIEASYPVITVAGTPYILPRIGDIYGGAVLITIAASGSTAVISQVIGPDGDPRGGAIDTVTITVDSAPNILTLSFIGGYPGAQTELKAGDTYQITGTTDKIIDAVDIQDFEAFDASLIVVAGTAFTVTGIISDRGTTLQQQAARVRVRNAAGAFGPTRDTNTAGGTVNGTDLVNLNNLAPSVDITGIIYPVSQSAIKDAEQATVDNVVSDFDTIVYDSPTTELTISNLTTYEDPKTVTRASGTYNVSINNFRITAVRNANAAVTVSQTVIQIADAVQVITVTEPAARLRSGGLHGTSAQDYTITITSDQNLLSAPSMDADSGGNRGAFQGSWAGSGAVWTRTLRVDETTPAEKGVFTWENLNSTNLAGRVQTVINTVGAEDDQYTLGGFVARTVNFAPFTANSTEILAIVDEAKLTAGSFSNGNVSVLQSFGTADTTDVGKEGWYAPTAASGAVNIRMLHTLTVGANSGGITLVSLEETI